MRDPEQGFDDVKVVGSPGWLLVSPDSIATPAIISFSDMTMGLGESNSFIVSSDIESRPAKLDRPVHIRIRQGSLHRWSRSLF